MAINPFSLEFGVQPPKYVARLAELIQIKEDFESPSPSSHMYAILGPRGCGKTVMLSEISNSFSTSKNWIVADLNCKDNLLAQLASIIDDRIKTVRKDISAEFSFSFSFATLTLRGKEHVSSLPVLLQKMFAKLQKHNIKVLVAIDDVELNEYVEVFVKEFQSLRSKKLDIFLAMTGLYSSFNHIQSRDGLTFLQRSPKVYLGPLNLKPIAVTFSDALNIGMKEAIVLAEFTKGYAFAFQCLGYILIKQEKTKLDDAVIADFDYYLEEGVYIKLAEELTPKEKEIIAFLAINGPASNQELFKAKILNEDNVSNYKQSLSRKGIIASGKRATFELNLPRLGEFMLSHYPRLARQFS